MKVDRIPVCAGGMVESNIQRLGDIRRGRGETVVQRHRLGAIAGTVRRRKEKC